MLVSYFRSWLANSSSSYNNIDRLQRKTKFYWSLIRLFVAILCFKMNSRYDSLKATFIFMLVICEFVSSKLSSRIKANLMIGAIYILKLWIGSQIKENQLWLVPFSMFLQVNLYMHGVPVPMLLGSTVASFFFISSVEVSFYSSRFEPEFLDRMFVSLFKGYKILSLNLMIGLIIINYLFVNTLKRYADTEIKLKEVQTKLNDATLKYEQILISLDKTNQALIISTKQLEATKAELESASREVEELLKADDMILNSISHELRNPLNSIIGNIELMLLEIKVPRFQEMLGISKVCGETLLSLINNLLDVVKIKNSRLELSPTPVRILEVLSQIWKMNAHKIANKGLNGTLYISTNIPSRLVLDDHRITQIVLNLIDNAVKFTNKGKVEVYVTWIKERDIAYQEMPSSLSLHSLPSLSSSQALNTSFEQKREIFMKTQNFSEASIPIFINDIEERSLGEPCLINMLPNFKSSFISDLDKICYKKFAVHETEIKEKFQSLAEKNSSRKERKGYLRIEIIDSGCGIRPEIQSKLFKPFMQGDPSITRNYGGLGLGLFITKHLLEKMGGTISLKSGKNRGTNFCLTIPCEVKNEPSSKMEMIEKFSRVSINLENDVFFLVKRALIVDDSPYNRTILENFLKKMNFTSETAENGLEALKKIKGNPEGYYSFIFMDLQMPVMDGLTTCKAIRKYEAETKVIKPIAIIIITGNATDIEKQYCLNPQGEIRASYFFRKPFNFSECQSCVEQVMENKQNKQ